MNENVKQVTPQRFRVRYRNRLIFAFVLSLVLSVLSQWAFVPHGHLYFTVDTEYWFYPAMGLMSSMILVLLSRFLGFILKRRESYWEEKD